MMMMMMMTTTTTQGAPSRSTSYLTLLPPSERGLVNLNGDSQSLHSVLDANLRRQHQRSRHFPQLHGPPSFHRQSLVSVLIIAELPRVCRWNVCPLVGDLNLDLSIDTRKCLVTNVVVFVSQVYKQKVKHLLFEQQTNMSEQKAENTLKLNLAKNEMKTNELDLRKDKRDLKVSMKEQQLQHEQTIKNLQMVKFSMLINIYIT